MTIEEAIIDFEKEYDYYNWTIMKIGDEYTITAWNPYDLILCLRGVGNNIPQAFLNLKNIIQSRNKKFG